MAYWKLSRQIMATIHTSKLFTALCAALSTKLVVTAEYDPQSTGRGERYNRTLVARLHNCIDEKEQEWDPFVDSLTHEFSKQMAWLIEQFLFSLTLSRKLLGSLTLAGARSSLEKYDGLLPSVVKSKVVDCPFRMIRRPDVKSSEARQQYKKNYDKQVKLQKMFIQGSRVFIDKSFVLTQNSPERTQSNDSSVEFRPIAVGLIRWSVQQNTR